MKPTSPCATRRRAFTLVELLTVLAIIALLAVLALPSVLGLVRGNQVTRNLAVLSGLLEQARQVAVAKNTFVWVAFSDAPATEPQEGVAVAVIGATGGTDPFGWGTDPISLVNNPDLELLAPVRRLERVKLSGAGTVAMTGLPPEAAENLAALETVDFQVPAGGATRRFTRAVQFTPTGEARVRAFRRTIEFALVPATGDPANVGVLRLAGLTGKAAVYRPE
jgi:prepilin-type N-terminal cleavage/methylation domain-containing protein